MRQLWRLGRSQGCREEPWLQHGEKGGRGHWIGGRRPRTRAHERVLPDTKFTLCIIPVAPSCNIRNHSLRREQGLGGIITWTLHKRHLVIPVNKCQVIIYTQPQLPLHAVSGALRGAGLAVVLQFPDKDEVLASVERIEYCFTFFSSGHFFVLVLECLCWSRALFCNVREHSCFTPKLLVINFCVLINIWWTSIYNTVSSNGKS